MHQAEPVLRQRHALFGQAGQDFGDPGIIGVGIGRFSLRHRRFDLFRVQRRSVMAGEQAPSDNPRRQHTGRNRGNPGRFHGVVPSKEFSSSTAAVRVTR